MNNKTESFKEKLRQALSSTVRVISDDLEINPKKNIKNSEKQDLIELENLNSKNLENDAFDLNNEDSDFQDLINRLKEIKSTIALLEKITFK